MNGEGQERISQKMEGGDVIFATNIAGRGTDIQLENSEFGLHTIISFYPKNGRVLRQNAGRSELLKHQKPS